MNKLLSVLKEFYLKILSYFKTEKVEEDRLIPVEEQSFCCPEDGYYSISFNYQAEPEIPAQSDDYSDLKKFFARKPRSRKKVTKKTSKKTSKKVTKKKVSKKKTSRK